MTSISVVHLDAGVKVDDATRDVAGAAVARVEQGVQTDRACFQVHAVRIQNALLAVDQMTKLSRHRRLELRAHAPRDDAARSIQS